MNLKPTGLVIVLGLAAFAPVATAGTTTWDWNLRLRHEGVRDDAFGQDAQADTARLRAAIHAALGGDWSLLVEAEGIASAGDRYNSGANGRSSLPAIADAAGVELNQAWIGWRGKRGAAILGRQRIAWDNQRWIGNSGWRQNEQTFDAVSFEAAPSPRLSLRYAWLGRVHRVAGGDALDPLARERDLSSHLFNAVWKQGAQQWVAYAYLHEDRDLAAASTATYGLRWSGTRGKVFGWTAEVARQSDHGNNPGNFSHVYWLLEPSLQTGRVNWKLGWEHLGGDGQHALQTPLATLHAFNGWADKFTTTPASGLEDRYLQSSAKWGKGTWTIAGHDYRADTGGRHYGSELDASLAWPLRRGWSGLVKLADYRSDTFARDTRKLWLQLEYTGSVPL